MYKTVPKCRIQVDRIARVYYKRLPIPLAINLLKIKAFGNNPALAPSGLVAGIADPQLAIEKPQ